MMLLYGKQWRKEEEWEQFLFHIETANKIIRSFFLCGTHRSLSGEECKPFYILSNFIRHFGMEMQDLDEFTKHCLCAWCWLGKTDWTSH